MTGLLGERRSAARGAPILAPSVRSVQHAEIRRGLGQIEIGLHAVGPTKVDELIEATAQDLTKQQEERAG